MMKIFHFKIMSVFISVFIIMLVHLVLKFILIFTECLKEYKEGNYMEEIERNKISIKYRLAESKKDTCLNCEFYHCIFKQCRLYKCDYWFKTNDKYICDKFKYWRNKNG